LFSLYAVGGSGRRLLSFPSVLGCWFHSYPASLPQIHQVEGPSSFPHQGRYSSATQPDSLHGGLLTLPESSFSATCSSSQEVPSGVPQRRDPIRLGRWRQQQRRRGLRGSSSDRCSWDQAPFGCFILCLGALRASISFPLEGGISPGRPQAPSSPSLGPGRLQFLRGAAGGLRFSHS
jgi:hypothetical protein